MDKATAERMFRQHRELVLSVAMAVLRDRHAAEDVSQEVFLKALAASDGLREPAKIKTWLAALARNRAIDHLRAGRRRADLARRKAADSEPEQAAGATVEDLLEGLREDYRQIVLLKYVQGLSYREIAGVLGTSPGAVGEKLHRVRRMILRHFEGSPHAV
jgi:RNA polymerase sigma factor (sigma-70 family)